MLNHKGESLEKNSTPRNNKLSKFCDTSKEGGRYMCGKLFGKNYDSLSLQQAQFIANLENWNDEFIQEQIKSEKDEEEKIVANFRTNFLSKIDSVGATSKIKMMNNHNTDKKDTLCMKPVTSSCKEP